MKTFTQILADLNGGEADELITDRLAEVVQAVEEYRGNGKLTVTLEIKHHMNGVASVQLGTVNAKSPQRPTAAEPFFYDKTNVGGLTKDDQRSQQPGLPGTNGNGNVTSLDDRKKAN
jgi:hypothetical protein